MNAYEPLVTVPATATAHVRVLAEVLNKPLLTAREYASELGLSKSYVARILESLRSVGYVYRDKFRDEPKARDPYLWYVAVSQSTRVLEAIGRWQRPAGVAIVAVEPDGVNMRVRKGDRETALAAYAYWRERGGDSDLVVRIPPSRAGYARRADVTALRVDNVQALLDWWALPF